VQELRSSIGPIRRAAAVAAFTLVAVGLAGCGSTSPASSPTTAAATTPIPTTTPEATTTASPTSTTAPPSTTARPSTTAPTSTAPPSTTAPTSTTVPTGGGSGRKSALAKRYTAIIAIPNTAGSAFSSALNGYAKGTTTLPTFKASVARYAAASHLFQTALLAVHWSASVDPLIRQIVTEDKKLVTDIERLESITHSKLKTPLDQVSQVLIDVHALSNHIRRDLGLPQTAN
jgi:hypothetical protein